MGLFHTKPKQEKTVTRYYTTTTSLWSSSTPKMLIFTPQATKHLHQAIGWLRNDYPENRNEQGGLLIGRYFYGENDEILHAEVVDVLMAQTDIRRPGYIEWSAMEEIRLQQLFFNMQDELEKTDPEMAKSLKIIGWCHTHPNDLPVFMSGTDMETQHLKYNKPEKYSVVINPHRGIWRAFAGNDALEVPAVMLLDPKESAEELEVEEKPKGKAEKKHDGIVQTISRSMQKKKARSSRGKKKNKKHRRK